MPYNCCFKTFSLNSLISVGYLLSSLACVFVVVFVAVAVAVAVVFCNNGICVCVCVWVFVNVTNIFI